MNFYTTNYDLIKQNMMSIEEAKRSQFINEQILNPTVFLQQALVSFSNVPLQKENNKISMSKTVKALPDQIVTPNGYITKNNLMAVIVILYHINRSVLVKKMVADPILGSYTPLFMYAHKLYNNVPYEDWDKNDEYIDFALGKFLWDGIKNLPKEKPNLTLEQVADARVACLTYKTGKKAGQTEKLTAYKMLSKYVINEVEYNKIQLFTLLQTWICNAEVRKEGSMLLDLWDWNNVPEPYDNVTTREVETTITRDILM